MVEGLEFRGGVRRLDLGWVTDQVHSRVLVSNALTSGAWACGAEVQKSCVKIEACFGTLVMRIL